MPDQQRQHRILSCTAALPLRQKIFLGLGTAVLLWNFTTLGQKILHDRQTRKENPYIFLGYKFSGLNEIIVGHSRLGYLTDKNMDDRVNAMEFAQAEYALAPITLDLNNPVHEYVILNYTSPLAAFAKVRELKLVVWKQNQMGIILARNPNAQGQ